jgi:hypothetical protein
LAVTSVISRQYDRKVTLCNGVSSLGVSPSAAEPTWNVAPSMRIMPAGQPADLAVRAGPERPTPPATTAHTAAASSATRRHGARALVPGLLASGAWLTVPLAAAMAGSSGAEPGSRDGVPPGSTCAAMVVAYAEG